MPTGVSLGKTVKQQIAIDVLAGFTVSVICERNGIAESTFYRLRKDDRVYKELEADLVKQALSMGKLRVAMMIGGALDALRFVVEVDPRTNEYIEEEEEGENNDGTPTLKKPRPVYNAKLIEQKRMAANDILNHATALMDFGEDADMGKKSIEQIVREQLASLLDVNDSKPDAHKSAEFWEKALELDPFEDSTETLSIEVADSVKNEGGGGMS